MKGKKESAGHSGTSQATPELRRNEIARLVGYEVSHLRGHGTTNVVNSGVRPCERTFCATAMLAVPRAQTAKKPTQRAALNFLSL